MLVDQLQSPSTKMDLASAVEFDWYLRIRQHPGGTARDAGFQALGKSGDGMGDYLDFLTARRDELRAAEASEPGERRAGFS